MYVWRCTLQYACPGRNQNQKAKQSKLFHLCYSTLKTVTIISTKVVPSRNIVDRTINHLLLHPSNITSLRVTQNAARALLLTNTFDVCRRLLMYMCYCL